MARSIKWRVPFKSLNGTSCRIDIYKEGYSGSIMILSPNNMAAHGYAAADPFYFEEETSDDVLNTVIRYRTGYIRLAEVGGFGTLDEIYPTEIFDRYVEVVYGSNVVFNGYIQVQDFSNEFVPSPRVIEFPVISPLGLFEKISFSTIIPPVVKTLGQLLDMIMSAHPITLPYQKVVVPQMNGTDLSQTVMSLVMSPWNKDYWHSMTTDTWNKVMSPEKCDYLIDAICKAFGWICHDTPTALVFTSFEHRSTYISYPVGHIGESGYASQESVPTTATALITYYDPADSGATVSMIQPDTGIEIQYEGEFGTIDFSFDRTYFESVEMIDASDPRESVSLCNLTPVANLFEVNNVSTLSFDANGKVNIGKACVVWKDYIGVMVSMGAWPSGQELFKIRYYTKKISGKDWTLSFDLMTSVRNIFSLKNDEDNVKYEHIGHNYNRQDNYVEITFKYYYSTTPLPSNYLLFFHNFKLEALDNNEPYAKYKFTPAKDSDTIPAATHPAISSSVKMPISKYRMNDRLIGDVLRTDKITEYPYLFQPRQKMVHKFRSTASDVPALYHAMLFSYFSKNWRIIAEEFHPWDDEYQLTMQNSPILDTSTPAPGPSPDPSPDPDPTPTPDPPGPTPPGPGPSSDNPVISINITITNNKSDAIVLDGEIAFVLGNPDHNGNYMGWLGEYNTTGHIRFVNAPVTIGPGQTASFNGLTWDDDGSGMGEKSPLDPSLLYLADRPRNVLLYVNGISDTILANNMDPSIIFEDGQTYAIVIPA